MSNVISLRNTGGFTRMDNDLYEALISADLSGRELRVALAIHRLTAVSEWKIEQKSTVLKSTHCVEKAPASVSKVTHIKDRKDNLVPSELVAAAAPTPVEVVEAQGEQPTPIPDQPDAQPERIPFQKIADLYNKICGQSLPQCLKLNEERKRNIRKCWNLKFNGGFPFRKGEFWEGYFNDCLTNRHWLGHNDREWRADIEFLTREKTVLKVLEGA